MDGAGLAKILTEMVHRQAKDDVLFNYSLMVKGSDLSTGMKDFMGPLIDILMDEAKAKEAGMDLGVRQKLNDDMMVLVDKETIIKLKAQKESR